MRLAHIREHNAAAGADWRLAAALDSGGARWVDLEIGRRRAVAANANLAHDSALHRQPVTTLDDHLGRGLRVAALADLVETFVPRDDDDAVLDAGDLAFGPPILRPPSFRDFYAFERHVRTMWERRDQEIPEAWYRLPIFYFSNVSELAGPAIQSGRAAVGAGLRAGGRGADRHAGDGPPRGTWRGGDRRLFRAR
jgi:hypothetical protein